MNVLVMKEDNTLLVKEQGSDWVRGEIAFIGESENGGYCFIPRAEAFRSGDLVEIARQIAFLNLEPVETKPSGAETLVGEQEKRTTQIRFPEGISVSQSASQAEIDSVLKARSNQIADRLLAAFDEVKTADGYLSDSDLLKASGVGRAEYLKVRTALLNDTCELVCLEPDVDTDSLYPLYHRVRSHAEELASAEAA